MGEMVGELFSCFLVPSVLFSFLFAIYMDTSMEDRRDFGSDSVISLILLGGYIFLASSFQLLPGRCVLSSLVR